MMLPRLLLLTDRAQLPVGVTLIEHIEKCLDAGVTHVVLRECDLPVEDRAQLCGELVGAGASAFAAREAVPLAVGLHQPSSPLVRTFGGLPDRPNVRTIGHPPVVGRSCHTLAEIRVAADDGCDYVTLSPFAASVSKPGYGPPLDPIAYTNLPIPTFALGGVTPANARQAIDAGAHGVAVMGAVMRSADPGRVVRALMEAVT